MSAAVLLTGCGGGAEDQPVAKPKGKASVSASPSASAAATPAVPVFVPARVGQCWNATVAQAYLPSWEGSGAVACTEKHNAVTYAVATLPEGLKFDGEGRPNVPLADAKSNCTFRAALARVGHSLSSPVRLRVFYYMPTPAQYVAGARLVRCDLTVKEGSVFRTLPSRLTTAAFAGHAYQICATGAHAKGPKKEGEASYAPCTRSSTFRLIKYVELKTRPNQRYPGLKAATARTQQACPMLRNGDWVVYPNKAKAWADGNTMGTCWRWVG